MLQVTAGQKETGEIQENWHLHCYTCAAKQGSVYCCENILEQLPRGATHLAQE